MKNFSRLIWLCIAFTYLVIMAGAVVRGTGSGLGCPDWPKCFGQWVPPTDISELPANYKEIYKIAGKTIADFDPYKTWTEYINRLLGVILGFFITILFGMSFSMKKYDKSLPWFCGGLFLLVSVQGGIGALVVSTHLKPFIITIHMFLAIVLLFGLLYLRKYVADFRNTNLIIKADPKALFLTRILIAITFFQVLVGTQVRQQVDHFIRDTQEATSSTIISFLGILFYLHRSFSFIVLAFFCYLLYYFHKTSFNRGAFFLSLLAFICVIGNILTGIFLNYFGFPAEAQPPHLFLGILTLGLLYSLSLNLRGSLLEG